MKTAVMVIHRKLFDKVKAHLQKKEFSIITGARQTGKSTILRQLESFCRNNNIPSVFLNLENKTILAELNDNPLNLLKFLPDAENRVVALVDEVQYLNDPSNFLKLLYDEHSDRVKIISTGSSSFYIDSRFKDSLAGRKKLFYLPTCSFDEYLELRDKLHLLEEITQIRNNPEYKSTLISYLKIEMEYFMIYGGYPAIITETEQMEKIERLRDIRDSFVKRDILEAGVNNQSAFYQLFRILASQSGNLVNINELSSTLRVKNETVSNYLRIMQKCFHITLIKPFFSNLRKELVKMPKVYILDNGLKNCLLNNFHPLAQRSDKGELWENVLFRSLSDIYGMEAIYFWRTSAGNEIDFVLPKIQKPFAIEAKFEKNQIKTSKYAIFKKAYPGLPLSYAWMNPFNEEFFRASHSTI